MAEFSRPFGTYATSNLNPTLKRWAILVCPSGTKRGQRQILVALAQRAAVRRLDLSIAGGTGGRVPCCLARMTNE